MLYQRYSGAATTDEEGNLWVIGGYVVRTILTSKVNEQSLLLVCVFHSRCSLQCQRGSESKIHSFQNSFMEDWPAWRGSSISSNDNNNLHEQTVGVVMVFDERLDNMNLIQLVKFETWSRLVGNEYRLLILDHIQTVLAPLQCKS